MVSDFLELGLSTEILNAVAELGFEKPTPVQGTVIPKLLVEDGDIVCLAQTGTGKTAAFGLKMQRGCDPSSARNWRSMSLKQPKF